MDHKELMEAFIIGNAITEEVECHFFLRVDLGTRRKLLMKVSVICYLEALDISEVCGMTLTLSNSSRYSQITQPPFTR